MDIEGYVFNEEYLYDEDHNWVKLEGNTAITGVTDLFQKTAGEIVFIEVPVKGRDVQKGAAYSSIESGKWVGRVKAPLSGKILEVNSELSDFPYLINESPYDEGWIIKIQIENTEELEKLFNLKDENQCKKYSEFIVAEKERIENEKAK